MVKSWILRNLLVKMHVKSWVLGVLSEKTEKWWTAAHLWWSPAAHSVCQSPGNDSEAMSASLSAITTASAKWVGEGRWWLPEAPSDYQGCCAKRISRVHSLHTIKAACKWASCVCRVNELSCTEACACMAYDCENPHTGFDELECPSDDEE